MTRERERASGRLAGQELVQIRQGQKARRGAGPQATYSVSASINPLVREVFEKMAEQKARYRQVAKKAGTTDAGIHNWRRGRHEPQLGTFMAVVQALGGKVRIEWASGEAIEPNPARHDLPSKLSIGPTAPIDPSAQRG